MLRPPRLLGGISDFLRSAATASALCFYETAAGGVLDKNTLFIIPEFHSWSLLATVVLRISTIYESFAQR